MVCANASRTYTLPLLVIGKSKEPRFNETTISVLFYLTIAAQVNQRPFREKTKVYNCAAKNKLLFSTIKVKLRHFAPILLFIQARFSHVMIFNIRLVSGFIYCMDRIRFSIIRTIAYPNGIRSQLIRTNDVLLYV
ncbi:uncharacterized protein TNCV_57861 [Trichonephila clavipes]|nr:uncharacterized protein TNCV_57861 [Trichonephila clavipes]